MRLSSPKTPRGDSKKTKEAGSNNTFKKYLFLALLALQFGLQPFVQKAFVNRDVPKTTMVLVGEGVKFAISLTMLLTSGQASSELAQWDLGSSLQAAAAPALVYSVQNVLVQTAYPNITSLMFNLLNQTKTLSAAVFVYLLMGKRQSLVQCLALAILFSAAVMLSTDFSGAKKDDDEKENNFMWGILPVLGASALSGFASGLCQVTLQGKKRNSFIFTMELCVFSTISLIAGMAVKDATQFSTDQLFHGWTHYTMIPIACQSVGGIIIGQVTKYAGGVEKGFALIAGIVVTGFTEFLLFDKPLENKMIVAGLLVSVSMYLHMHYPYQAPTKKA